jgi:hypothetical protein
MHSELVTVLGTLLCLFLLALWYCSPKPRKHVGPLSDADADDTPEDDGQDPEKIDREVQQ